jgi:hypothetical protein
VGKLHVSGTFFAFGPVTALAAVVKVRLVSYAAERGVGLVGRIVEASPIMASSITLRR